MLLPSHALGRRGERLAERHLVARGWTVLERNYRFRRREVDLIVRRGGVLAFVEVKARSGGGFGDPLEAITWKKRREIEAVAAHYLARTEVGDVEVRFDAVALRGDGRGRLEILHVPDAWRPEPAR